MPIDAAILEKIKKNNSSLTSDLNSKELTKYDFMPHAALKWALVKYN